jgi:hypothetical protein
MKCRLTKEQLSKVIIVGRLKEVEPSHVAKVGAELLRVPLAQHLHRCNMINPFNFVIK